jgi:hypothetical protein
LQLGGVLVLLLEHPFKPRWSRDAEGPDRFITKVGERMRHLSWQPHELASGRLEASIPTTNVMTPLMTKAASFSRV